jgi:hypothetical protein
MAQMDLIRLIQASLSDDLLKPEFRGAGHPMAGHCYVASEAYHHLSDMSTKPKRLRHEGVMHWWLEGADGTVIDITAGQFGTSVPYEEGIGCGFLTVMPSRRAKLVMIRVERLRCMLERFAAARKVMRDAGTGLGRRDLARRDFKAAAKAVLAMSRAQLLGCQEVLP